MTKRTITLCAGLGVAAVAGVSPLAHLDHHLLTAHMVQHLVLMLVAAPLILAGLRPAAAWQLPLALCWMAGSITVLAWHVPAVFELALRSGFWHGFEQASFLMAGLIFWLPVFTKSGWSIPIYLFLATLPCDALSAFLTFCGHVVYQPYSSPNAGMFGLSPVDDQQLAGALMWVAVTFAYLIPAMVITSQLISGERVRSAEIRAA